MKIKLVSLLIVMTSFFSFAQEEKELTLKEKEKIAYFEKGFSSYSRKKPAYITLKTGEKLEGHIKGLGRKKGQIREVKFENGNGDVTKIPASEIQELYMAPSNLEKLGAKSDFFSDATKWGKADINDVVNKGYTYYLNQNVSLKNKKKEQEYLMQMVNTKYSSKIQVFFDPWAGETASIGVGGLKLAGGIAKSYYVKKGDKMIWLHKRNLDDYFEMLFLDNEKFKKEYADKKIKWSLLGVYILDYTRFSKS